MLLFCSSSGFKWDPHRSPRWNQDAQREEGEEIILIHCV